tara:strand:+ start:4926 stop:5267 length:342 start_codon:yes stop_codon:yes gene_type:complete
MSFEEHIKEWVALDNQLKLYNDKIKQIKEKRARVSEKILDIENFDTKLCNKSLEISDGRLKFVNSRIASNLTFKYVEDSLKNIIQNDKQVSQIIQYLKENREIKMVPEIKRFS